MIAVEALERAAVQRHTHPGFESERRHADARGLVENALRAALIRDEDYSDTLMRAERMAVQRGAKMLAFRLRSIRTGT